MLTETERRAAAQAVSRYGASVALVEETVLAVLQLRAKGEIADLLNSLVGRKLLSPSQANELRRGLDITRIDSNQRRPGKSADAKEASNHTPLFGQGHPRRVGPYQILRRLGEGGMATVYLAYEEGRSQYVAVKVLPFSLADDRECVERFHREARSFLQLNHPNIVRGIAVDRDAETGTEYMALEYVEGPSLQSLLDRFGRLAIGDAVHVTLDVARGLEHAHSRNIIHRDIKPDNILLTASGVAKLVDWGLAKNLEEDTRLTGRRQGFGTPYYMPYEQIMNARQADGRSDIYALGATLYHLVAGCVPFPGNNPLEIGQKKATGKFPAASASNPAASAALDGILGKMMAQLPGDRYQTVSELIVDLERSNLSAQIPSFVDAELALQDPVVRAQLDSAPQLTQLDLSHDSRQSPRRANDTAS
jgi:serine/threonine protein kinase